MDSLWTPRYITSLDGLCYEAIDSSILQNIFSYLKMFSMQCRKSIVVEDNKKRMNIANYIYIQIYIPMLYFTRMTQNKNDSINSVLQHGRVVDNSCCVVFPTSRFPYLILCPRRVWKSPAVKASTNYKKQHRTLQSLRKNKNNNFIIFIRSISR